MASVLELTYPNFEIILVDTGSRDGSGKTFVEMGLKKRPDITIKTIFDHKNQGFAKGNNMGLQHAIGEYVAFVSNDVRLSQDWLSEMVNGLKRQPRIGVIQSRLFSLYNEDLLDPIGDNLSGIGFNCPYNPRGDLTETFYAEFSATLVKREVIDDARGLFDEDYFAFFEDVDFCWRARLVGYEIGVLNSTRAYHARGGISKGVVFKEDPFHVFLTAQNRLSTIFKCYSIFNLMKYLPLSMFVQLIEVFYFCLEGKKKHSIAIISGILAFLLGLRRLSAKRAKVQSIRTVNDDIVLRRMVPLRKYVLYLINLARESVTR